MPIDPQDGGLDDWFVPASPQGDADGPDDWFVPASDGYPDDWFVPASAAPVTAQPALGARPSNADPALASRSAPRPDPFAAFWPVIPASKWVMPPPIFPDAFGQFSLLPAAPPATPRLDAGYGLLGGLGNLSDPGSPPTYGLFGVLKNSPSANPAAFPSYQGAGPVSGNGDQSAPPPFLSSLANLAWSPPGVSDAGSDAGGYALESDGPSQSSPPDGCNSERSRPMHRPAWPRPRRILKWRVRLHFPLQTTGLTSDNGDRSARQSPPSTSGPDQLAPSAQSADVEDNSGSSPPAASTLVNCGRSCVMRDSAGHPLAIIHVQPARPMRRSPRAMRRQMRCAPVRNMRKSTMRSPVIHDRSHHRYAPCGPGGIGVGNGVRAGCSIWNSSAC